MNRYVWAVCPACRRHEKIATPFGGYTRAVCGCRAAAAFRDIRLNDETIPPASPIETVEMIICYNRRQVVAALSVI